MEHFEPADQAALKALYESDSFLSSTEILMEALGISREHASAKMKHVLKLAANASKNEAVEYRFYASEIVRAFQNGYLLEIQEPNVIRDAAVLMALNSALEPAGTLNLPTGIVHRHPDFIAVITANRSYAGSRPLNEALRDRIQHSEKMDLPSKDTMIERAKAKIGCEDDEMLDILASVIILLDQTARTHAIKGLPACVPISIGRMPWLRGFSKRIPLSQSNLQDYDRSGRNQTAGRCAGRPRPDGVIG